MKFKDNVAIVTGGTTGIGKACCMRLKAEGAIVYNLDVADDGGREIPFVKCDVRNYSEVQTAVNDIFEKEGKIDLLFANAGIHITGNIEETSIEAFENVLSVNLKGLFYTVKAVIPLMKDRNQGRIVLMGSDQSFIGKPRSSVYGLTKGAIGQFTKSTAIDYAGYNIRVNCICPGTIRTPLMLNAMDEFHRLTKIDRDEIYKSWESAQPLKKIAEPEEIANVVCFLLSDESSFMTGALIAADGGYTCQ